MLNSNGHVLVTGLFMSRSAAESAVASLLNVGHVASDISVLAAGTTETGSLGLEQGSHVGSGAAVGAGLGGALGALLVGFTTVGALFTGGAALVAAGPIVAALAGAGAGAAAGGIVGGLIGLGIPEYDVKYYAEEFEKGSVLLGVRAPLSEEKAVRELLKRMGATRVAVGSLPAAAADGGRPLNGTSKLSDTKQQDADEWANGNPLRRLFMDQLRDIYYAEHQMVDSLEKLEQNASTPELASAFREHRDETQGHIFRLETAFDLIGVKPEQRRCRAINGIIAEADELLKLDDTLPQRDAAMICAAQKAEHYEIGTYGCLRTYARTLDLSDVASLLEQTLQEEWDADRRLSDLAQTGINDRAKVMQAAV